MTWENQEEQVESKVDEVSKEEMDRITTHPFIKIFDQEVPFIFYT